MLKLNIIPEEQKRDIKIKYFYDQSKDLFGVMFFVLVIFVIAFLIMKLVLANHFVTTIENTTMLTKRTEDFSKKVADINRKMDNVSEIQSDFVYWSKLIEIIRKNQTNGLKLNSISIDKTNNSVSLSGNSKTREDLLELKEKLENLNLFEEINLPIEILLQKNNLNFNLVLGIKSYDFQ